MCLWCLICWELKSQIKTTNIKISLINIWIAVSLAIAADTSYAIDFELIYYKWPVNHPLIIYHKLTSMPYFQLIGFNWKLHKTSVNMLILYLQRCWFRWQLEAMPLCKDIPPHVLLKGSWNIHCSISLQQNTRMMRLSTLTLTSFDYQCKR